MPGVGIAPVIANHAITLDEFMTVYNIYKKYDGLDPLRMSKEEQREWNERYNLCEQFENY